MSEHAYMWVTTPNGPALTVTSSKATSAEPPPADQGQQATADVAKETVEE